MPPLIVWTLGAVGAAVLAKIIAEAARRAKLEAERKPIEEMPMRRLERDPATGEYRPPTRRRPSLTRSARSKA